MRPQCNRRTIYLGWKYLVADKSSATAYQQFEEERAHTEDVGLSSSVPWQLHVAGDVIRRTRHRLQNDIQRCSRQGKVSAAANVHAVGTLVLL